MAVCLLYCSTKLLGRSKSSHQEIALCTVYNQEESRFMPEWLEYHRLLGIDRFYIINTEPGNTACYALLRPYSKAGLIQLLEPSQGTYETQQPYSCEQLVYWYNLALKKINPSTRWLAFIDIDEFIVPAQESHFKDFLASYEQYAAISMHWVMFGTSSIERLSSYKLMIEQLTRCKHTENAHAKFFVRPERILSMEDPYTCIPKAPYTVKDLHIDSIQLNHYWTRDEFYFHNIKIPLITHACIHASDTPAQSITMQPDQRAKNIAALLNTDQDMTIQRYVPRLKKMMARHTKKII